MAIKLEKLSLTWEEILDMDFARFSLAEVGKMSSEDKHEFIAGVIADYNFQKQINCDKSVLQVYEKIIGYLIRAHGH
jgi:hypothetical protein|tara:strand:+ start:161 stop:391 length:231 start_codon:yes stop_codon:yes gene_type:complete